MDISKIILCILLSTLLIACTGGESGTADTPTDGPVQEDTSVTISWRAPEYSADGSTLNDLTGYKLYYGTAPGVYTASIDAGNATSVTTTDLPSGNTYYFAVTAYDQNSNESELSLEINMAI